MQHNDILKSYTQRLVLTRKQWLLYFSLTYSNYTTRIIIRIKQRITQITLRGENLSYEKVISYEETFKSKIKS